MSALLLVLVAAAHGQSPTPAEFETQAVLRWDALEDAMRNVRGRVLYRRMYEKETTKEVLFKFRDAGFGVTESTDTTDEKNKPKTIVGRNDRYVFDLQAVNDSDPIVRMLDFSRHDEVKFKLEVWTVAVRPWQLGNQRLRDIIHMEGFAIGGIEPTDTGVLISFDYKAASESAPKLLGGIETGTMEFTKDWLLTRFEGRYPNGTGAAGTSFEYKGELQPGVPRVSQVVYFAVGTDPKDRLTEEFTVVELELANVAYEEFTLSHYGLPEPGGSSNNLLRNLVIGAIVCGVIAIGLRLWSRRR